MRAIDRIGFKDRRSPMLRLLGQQKHKGYVSPEYHQQWKTIFKAIDLGFLEEGDVMYILTEKGEAELIHLEEMEA